MSKLRIIHIASLVILGVLLVFTVFRPMATGEKYSEVSRGQLLQTEEEYIIQFDIMNHEDQDKNYTVNLTVDGLPSTITVSVRARGVFTYIKHIYKDQVTKGEVSFAIYKGDEVSCVKEATYHLQ